jgi:hypothetical protein
MEGGEDYDTILHGNGYCTAMWKANGKTTTLSLFLDGLFPKTEIPCIRDASSGDK